MLQFSGAAAEDAAVEKNPTPDATKETTVMDLASVLEPTGAVNTLGSGLSIQFEIVPSNSGNPGTRPYQTVKDMIPIKYIERNGGKLDIFTVMTEGKSDIKYTITADEADVLVNNMSQLLAKWGNLKDEEYLIVDNGPMDKYMIGRKKLPSEFLVAMPVKEQDGKYSLYTEAGKIQIIFAHLCLENQAELKTVKKSDFKLEPEHMVLLGENRVLLTNGTSSKGTATGNTPTDENEGKGAKTGRAESLSSMLDGFTDFFGSSNPSMEDGMRV